jgi:aryl-alcohol dehydrogenase-like predicted oxidoreductase
VKYKLLGRSGLRVSEICLGTMTFGSNWGWGANPDECKHMLDHFLDVGGNFVDTANLYTFGDAERILGEVITPERRRRCVLASKFSDAPLGNDANAGGNHRKSMMQSIDDSLKRLKTDCLDIYYIHTWDFTCRPDEVLRALDDLTTQGKILYAGISNAPAWVISRCNEQADNRGWTPFVVNQIEYSLIERTPEREQIPMSRTLDIGVVAWSPLAGGLLTGKYSRGGKENEPRRMDVTVYKSQTKRSNDIAVTVDRIADEIGRSSSEVALAWIGSKGIIPIIGGRSVSQIAQNLEYPSIELEASHLAELEKVSQIDLGFPHDFFESAKGFVYGGMFDNIHRHRDDGIGRSGERRIGLGEADINYTDVVVP